MLLGSHVVASIRLRKTFSRFARTKVQILTQPGWEPLWALNLLALLVQKSTNTDTLESHVVCNPPTKNFGCDRRPKKTGFTLPILLFPDFSREVPPATSKLAKLVKHKWLRIRCVCGLSSSFFLKQARSLFLSLSGVCTLLPPPPPPPCPVLE